MSEDRKSVWNISTPQHRMELDPSHPDQTLPRDLIADLKRIDASPVQLPAHFDRVILSAARVRLTRQRRVSAITRWAALAAVAAVVFLGLRVSIMHPASPPRVAQVADINGDGHVDIIDAFIIARALSHHEKSSPAWDINKDGVVDQKDVDAIARQAVRLAGGPR